MYKNYYILIEVLIIDIVFLILVHRYLKFYKLEKLVDKKRNKAFDYMKSKPSLNLENNIYNFFKRRIKSDRLAFECEKDFKNYIIFQYVTPVLILILIFAKLGLNSFPLILVPFLYYGSNRIKYKKIKSKRHLSFQKNTYKIYTFIYNQLSSGVRPHDCVMGLYDVIEDKYFKRTLINMSAIYSQTSDIDLSLEEIVRVYPGIDAIMLCSAIKQGVKIGSNMETVERQEKLAFNKYFVYIKSETEKIRFKGFLSISLFAFIIILLISVPLLYEMKEATSKIFMN
ncbi:MAG: hypothetical protein WBA54_00210 [Acidaminobacteraceae bacterium]